MAKNKGGTCFTYPMSAYFIITMALDIFPTWRQLKIISLQNSDRLLNRKRAVHILSIVILFLATGTTTFLSNISEVVSQLLLFMRMTYFFLAVMKLYSIYRHENKKYCNFLSYFYCDIRIENLYQSVIMVLLWFLAQVMSIIKK